MREEIRNVFINRMKVSKVLVFICMITLVFATTGIVRTYAEAKEIKLEIGTVMNANDDTKMYQIPLAEYAGIGVLKQITANITFDQTEAQGWVGGGGANGYSSVSGWQQFDYEHSFIDGEVNTVDIVTECSDDATYDEDSLVQIGWWWGSTETVTLNSVTLLFEIADETDDSETEADVTADGTTTDEISTDGISADETITDDTESDADLSDAAQSEDANAEGGEAGETGLPQTGTLSTIVFYALGMCFIAGGAKAVSKNRQDK